MPRDRRDYLTLASLAVGLAGIAALVWSVVVIGTRDVRPQPPPAVQVRPLPCTLLPEGKPALLMLRASSGALDVALIEASMGHRHFADSRGRRVWLYAVVQDEEPSVSLSGKASLKAQAPQQRQPPQIPARGGRGQ